MHSTGINNYIRALRLPFITASVLPFILGSFLNHSGFLWINFILGLMCVVFTHLGSNLINDYADSRSGADWQDKNFYKFFGGSKLIQEGIFSEKFYLLAGMLCFSIAILCVLILAVLFNSFLILGFYFLVLFLGFSYSHKPLRLSYNMLGEITIFVLFGPALVMGGYFVKKRTLINLTGRKKAFLFYLLLMISGLIFIIFNVIRGYLNPLAFCTLFFIFPVIKVVDILKKHYNDKTRLIESSKITIIIHTAISILLILSIIL
jgi:1,4-dihydroxy-2-naphthoate octaprenyltransferase